MSKKDVENEEKDERFNSKGKMRNSFYQEELEKLQQELVKMQYWIKSTGYRLVIIFEGRDAAGKGGIIKRIQEPLNPRGARVVALDKPNDKEKTQWYFQRYVSHLPSAGEIVIFDRSWYNRTGVERVMGFCTDEEYVEFLRSCPEFERMLVRSGIVLLKYWITVSPEEQEARFKSRAEDPARRWKLSPIDIASWDKWDEYSRAKDDMMKYTDIKHATWYNVHADDKKKARLNCIAHILEMVPYKEVVPEPFEFPERIVNTTYIRIPIEDLNSIPEKY